MSLMAAMDGMLAGIMGGMMGAMLGVMLVIPTTMVWFINIVFFAVMFVLLQLIEEESGSARKETNETKKSFFSGTGMVVAMIALVGMIFVLKTELLGASQASSNGNGVQATAQEESKG
ncbi:hypothetical protein MOQ26_21520, partial [Stenotrophomonas maltophilia]|nr:hypothetical protein [Stenotrophomonas maltophilia]